MARRLVVNMVPGGVSDGAPRARPSRPRDATPGRGGCRFGLRESQVLASALVAVVLGLASLGCSAPTDTSSPASASPSAAQTAPMIASAEEQTAKKLVDAAVAANRAGRLPELLGRDLLAGRVYALTRYGPYSNAAVLDPESPHLLGIGLHWSPTRVWIRPTDGRALYLDRKVGIREYVPDQPSKSPEADLWVFPDDLSANDPVVVPAERCQGPGMDDFLVDPQSGEVVYSCRQMYPSRWFTQEGEPVDLQGSLKLLSVGFGGSKLLGEPSRVVDSSGMIHPLPRLCAPLPNSRSSPKQPYFGEVIAVRSRVEGFWLLCRYESDVAVRSELWDIDTHGNVVSASEHATLPLELELAQNRQHSALDAEGAVVSALAYDKPGEPYGHTLIVRRPLVPGHAEIVFACKGPNRLGREYAALGFHGANIDLVGLATGP